MTEDDLAAAGYHVYRGPGTSTNADRFHVRTIPSPDGRCNLYSISFFVWDYSDRARWTTWPKDQDPVRLEAEADLYAGTDRLYRLNIPVRAGDTVGGIEAEYRRAYEALGCVPDRDNNDK